MTAVSELEIQGSFLSHPFAELLAEVAITRLTGSIRASSGDRKSIFYFKNGSLIFAVSNARSVRLYQMLLELGKLQKEDLVHAPNFTNDLELAAYLEGHSFLTKDECSRMFAQQIDRIIVDALGWQSGDWSFSPLARIRDGLSFPVDTDQILIDFARCLGVDAMLKRFRSLDETFTIAEKPLGELKLNPNEALILSRITDEAVSASNLIALGTIPEADVLRSLYTLWLPGLIERKFWQNAFSREKLVAIRNAKLGLKTEAKYVQVSTPKPVEAAIPVEVTPVETVPEAPTITLEEYLERVENALTHYEILGVAADVAYDEIKKSYFNMARMFHPDRYHSIGGDTLKRIQNAFTELAQAHETLKTTESREVYDYRMRKEIAEREKMRSGGGEGEKSVKAEQAEQNFERGFSLLMDDEVEDALPFLARAAHLSPTTARYRAYYGKALSGEAKSRHKAEAEMQAAVKIDPNNATFRKLLAEFFIQVNLLKRAEGELNRLLVIAPNDMDALDMLASIKK